MECDQLVKYSLPTMFDKHPQGTVWCSVKEEGEPVKYIQLSEDQDNPQWATMGSFIAKTFEPFIANKEFINACIRRDVHISVPASDTKGARATLYL